MKEDNNDLNSPLKEGEINTNSNVQSNEIVNDNPQIKGSKEKIIHLKRGYKVWRNICIIFVISLFCFPFFLTIVLTYEGYNYLLVFVVPSGIGLLFCFVMITCCNGFIIINPNEAVVYQYYGRYLGTVKDNGYFYGYPFAQTTRISLRSNQYNGNRLKVNERDGNPVELGIIIVWRIGDTAKTVFDVVGYYDFIHTQSEAAIRYIGCKYPYEPVVPGEVSLRGGQEIINKELREELERRVKISGIIIEDARVTEISYGMEVARTMLQKQASNSAVIAKGAIVKGASNAVMNSLKEFENKGYKFTNEKKTKYVTTLMRTLCMSSDVSKIMGK